MTDRQPETNNYLATNFFKLELERAPLVTYFCQSVNLPSLTIPVLEVPVAQFGVPIRTPVGRYSYENMSVSFLVDEEMKNWLEIYNWMIKLGTAEQVCDALDHENAPNGKFSDAVLTIMNGSYNPIKKIILKDIFPVGVSGIQFSSVIVDTEPVIATATFAFTSYVIEDFINDP